MDSTVLMYALYGAGSLCFLGGTLVGLLHYMGLL